MFNCYMNLSPIYNKINDERKKIVIFERDSVRYHCRVSANLPLWCGETS